MNTALTKGFLNEFGIRAEHLFPLALALIYLIGFAIVALHLAGYGVSPLELLRLQYLAAGLPNRSRSGANPDSFYERRSIIDRIPYLSTLRKMKQQMSWGIFVLDSDYEKARQSML